MSRFPFLKCEAATFPAFPVSAPAYAPGIRTRRNASGGPRQRLRIPGVCAPIHPESRREVAERQETERFRYADPVRDPRRTVMEWVQAVSCDQKERPGAPISVSGENSREFFQSLTVFILWHSLQIL